MKLSELYESVSFNVMREIELPNGKKGWDIVNDEPGLNLSNTNAVALLDFLGLDTNDELYGILDKQQLIKLQKKLFILKNSDTSSLTIPSYTEEPQMGPQGTDGNITQIGRRGPTVYHGGRTPEQVERYLDKLLTLVTYAIRNNYSIGWS